jgi:hypothetical protein
VAFGVPFFLLRDFGVAVLGVCERGDFRAAEECAFSLVVAFSRAILRVCEREDFCAAVECAFPLVVAFSRAILRSCSGFRLLLKKNLKVEFIHCQISCCGERGEEDYNLEGRVKRVGLTE